MKKPLKWPDFKNEDKVTEWLDATDFSKHLESSDFKRVNFPNLKPSKRLISLRLEDSLVEKARQRAVKLHIPYQTLMRQILHEGLA